MLSLAPVWTASVALTGAGTGVILFEPEFAVTLDLAGAGTGTLLLREADLELALTLAPVIKGDPGEPGEGASEIGPEFTWVSGVLTRVDYDSGNYKLLTYLFGKLSQLDYVKGLQTIRKTFNYNLDGTLQSVDQAII